MKESLKIKLANLPDQPGVYLMKDKSGKILYIGKAKNLKNRVRSYFHQGRKADYKTDVLVSRIEDFELLATDSEMEALILEANLVKEHKPRFNVNLKDDKRYPYLKLTVNEPFPRLSVERRVKKDGARYFGPYTNVTGMRRTLKFLMSHFGIRSCNYEIPSSTGREYKVCLDYHIGRCAGACVGFETAEHYAEHVSDVILFLSGKRIGLIDNLKQRMQTASTELKFEEATKLRDTIEAMESTQRRQKVDIAQAVDRDVVAFARDAGDAVAAVMQIREGILIGRQDLQLKVDREMADDELLSGFLKQYYNQIESIPDELLLPLNIDDAGLIKKWLTEAKGSKVTLIIPQKGQKHKIVGLAETNARLLLDEMLIQKKKYQQRVPKSAAALQKILRLERAPVTVTCFDISNLGETDKVASLVYFEKGKPLKREYRHFKIKTVEGQDDFAAMREVVERYVSRRIDEEKPLPDLMMVDGGKGQLSGAKEILDKLGCETQPIIGLAKRLEEVFVPNRSAAVMIPKSSPALALLKKVRDEAHRFAISYHRKLRGKRVIASELNGIHGVGETRKTILLKHFGSVKKIKEASIAELSDLKGIPQNLAQAIFQYFHPTK